MAKKKTRTCIKDSHPFGMMIENIHRSVKKSFATLALVVLILSCGDESCPRHLQHPRREGVAFISQNRTDTETMSKTRKKESREWMSVPQAELLGCSIRGFLS